MFILIVAAVAANLMTLAIGFGLTFLIAKALLTAVYRGDESKASRDAFAVAALLAAGVGFWMVVTVIADVMPIGGRCMNCA